MTVAALVLIWIEAFGGSPEGAAVLIPVAVVAGPVMFVSVSAAVTVAYVLPAVALAHWFARRTGRRRQWRWVAASGALGLLPAAGLPTLFRILHGGLHDWRRIAVEGLVFAGVLWIVATPAAVAAHMTVLREDAGDPIRPVGDILLWGTLGLSIELTGWLACL
ncbi:hypothetical protein [Streptomyces melanogenes]|uniref:hypothetical protein n=1 Tax=Streptomyces melanogenes TaxID=67326 RepID=UPI001E39143C|nr:hypothetical protein [Streptomyces melanogenes]